MSAAVAIGAEPVLCLVCRKYIAAGVETDEVSGRILHAACAVKLRERREEERLDALARGQCRRCHGPLGESPTFELYQGQMDAFHAECWARIEELDREREEHARKTQIVLAVSETDGSWKRSRYGVMREHDSLLTPPKWEWNRFDNPDFAKRVNATLLALISAYEPTMGSLVVSGPTGCGKTSLIDAWFHREYAKAIRRAETEAKPTRFSFAFMSGHELVGARRNTKLGTEAPLVELAKGQRLLVLDEVGYERQDEVLMEVVDHRYRAGNPTIVTTGLKDKEFITRYGQSMFRKLTESGALIEGWKK